MRITLWRGLPLMRLTRLNVLLPGCIPHWGSSHISLKGLMELLSVPKTMFVYLRSPSRWCFHQRRIWWHKVLRLRLLEMCIHSRCSKTEDSWHLLWKHLEVVFMLSCCLPWALHDGIEIIIILSRFTHLHVLPNLCFFFHNMQKVILDGCPNFVDGVLNWHDS